MHSTRNWRSTLWAAGFSLLAVAGVLIATACGESDGCKSLRDQTYANKRVWDACSFDDDCIAVPGNQKDCTGVLTCEFSVNKRYRDLAEMAVYKIGEQSQGCHLCAFPNCIAGAISVCEQVSKRCIIVSELKDGGGVTQGTEDAGGNPPVDSGGLVSNDTGVPDSGATD
jgi:hypothetical protein